MIEHRLDWTPDLTGAVGKGATVQVFRSTAQGDELTIETTPWGDGDLIVNGVEVAAVHDADDGEAFRDLEARAEAIEAARSDAPAADRPGV